VAPPGQRALPDLLEADSIKHARRAVAALERDGYEWTPLGGKESNFGLVNIGSDPDFCVLERIANALDAVITKRRVTRPLRSSRVGRAARGGRRAVWHSARRLTRAAVAFECSTLVRHFDYDLERYRSDVRLPKRSILALVRTSLFDPVLPFTIGEGHTRFRHDPQAPAAVVYAGRFADLQPADAALYRYAARSGLSNAMERVSRFRPARMGQRFAMRRLVATRGINGSLGIAVPFRPLKTVNGGSNEASFELPARPRSAILVRQNDQKEQLLDAGHRVQGALPRTDGSCRELGRDDYDNETWETRGAARSPHIRIHVLLRLPTGNGRRRYRRPDRRNVGRRALILLDTHVAVWYAAGIELKPRIVALIGEAAQQNGVFLSAISAWEIGMLVAKGRLVLGGSAEAYVRDLYSREGVVEEPVTSTIAELSSRLPGVFHGDPADRIIVASAALRSATLATRDDRILSYARKTGLVKIAPC